MVGQNLPSKEISTSRSVLLKTVDDETSSGKVVIILMMVTVRKVDKSTTHIIKEADEDQVDASGRGGGEHDGVVGDEHAVVLAQHAGADERHAVQHHAQHRGQRQQHQQRHQTERHERGG